MPVLASAPCISREEGPVEHDDLAARELLTRSPAMLRVLEVCQRVARTAARVLILGETGTGKELLARAIHRASGRSGGFVAVNCGAIPVTLIESELFGHEKGAFTGAAGRKPGLFAHAEGGTLLLDEVGELPLAAQASLLRVLQESRVRPVGGARERAIDVRVLAATSLPLDVAAAEGRFRADLLYRLDVIRVEVPPLRQRPEDVRPLFERYVDELALRHRVARPCAGPAFLEALTRYAWPGNVRQLVTLAERAVLTHEGPLLAEDLPALLGTPLAPEPAVAACGPLARPRPLDLHQGLAAHLERAERDYLEAALRRTRGRVQATASLAGLCRRTLSRKLRRHGLDRRALLVDAGEAVAADPRPAPQPGRP